MTAAARELRGTTGGDTSAETPVVRVSENVMQAAIARMEEDAHIIRGLRQQNARLKEELLNAQLEASLEIAKHKFAAAQVGEAHRRIAALEEYVAKLDEAQNRTGNIVQGLPQRDEFEALKSEHYALSGRVPV